MTNSSVIKVGYATVSEKDFWEEFLLNYKELPCLWNIKSPHYSNRTMRQDALDTLVTYCQQANPRADRDYVLRKICNFRTSFRREYRKVQQSLKTAKTFKQIHKTTLWYYNLMLFLVKDGINETTEEMPIESVETFSQKTFNLKRPQTTDSKSNVKENENNVVNIQSIEVMEYSNFSNGQSIEEMEQFLNEQSTDEMEHFSNGHSIEEVEHFSNEQSTEELENFDVISNEKLNDSAAMDSQISPICVTKADEFDVLGQYVAHQLRNYENPFQRIYFQRLISEGIFMMQLGQLTDKTYLDL